MSSNVVAKTLMIQGTASDAGKTTLVAGLCRLFARAKNHINVAPFKPQNMALNSAVTIDKGEIGRAQALQAQACFQDPHTDFNPVLLKPSSDTHCQIIIQGQALTSLEANEYWGKTKNYQNFAMTAVLNSYERLKHQYQLIFVEGAGSPAEINLREGDIANMGFAEAVDCPVILIADIDKGGVFAQIVGTLTLLSDSEKARIKGVIINRFRGDISLLQSGIDWLEKYIQKPVLGVLPFINDLHLDAEDALITHSHKKINTDNILNVSVLVYPRISNHTDFDPLRLHPNVNFTYIDINSSPENCAATDLLILPGSKHVCDDLKLLIKRGWVQYIHKHLRYGGKLMGICGGYQMLGFEIDDSQGIEGKAQVIDGLELLPIITALKKNKSLYNVSGILTLNNQTVPIKGYEIHCGKSHVLRELKRPCKVQRLDDNDAINIANFIAQKEENNPHKNYLEDGLLSDDNNIFGTYLHGIFDNACACDLILEWAGLNTNKGHNALNMDLHRELQLERLADTIEQHINMPLLNDIIERRHHDRKIITP